MWVIQKWRRILSSPLRSSVRFPSKMYENNGNAGIIGFEEIGTICDESLVAK